MTAFFKATDTQGVPLNKVFAEDPNQFVNVLSGVADAGALSLLAPIATPSSAPTIALSAGGITGTGYQWGFYWITGIQDGRGTTSSNNVAGRTPYGTLSVAQPLTAQQATVTLPSSVPTGVIGWGVARNKSGGGTWYTVPGSEQFLNAAGNMPASFVDNVSDASLVTLAPTVNTTGTTFPGGELARGTFSSSIQCTATTEATATQIVAAPSIYLDGSTTILVMFECGGLSASASGSVRLALYAGSSSVGLMNTSVSANSMGGAAQTSASTIITPSAGTYTYSVRGFSPAATGYYAYAGVGGAGTNLPGYMRILRLP